MAYALEADLDATFGKALVDIITIDPSTLVRNEIAIQQALDDASALIDGYVSVRYPLPLALTPGGVSVVRGLCCNIALCALASTADRMSDIIQKRRDEAVKFLTDVAAGRANAPIFDPTAQPEPLSPNEVLTSFADRTFSPTTLGGF